MSEKIVACIIARTNSTRLPFKVLRNIVNYKCMLDVIIDRIKLSKGIDEIYLCTSNVPEDEILEDVAEQNQIKIYRGDPIQVIERMLTVSEKENAQYVIRITGDNVFTDPYILSRQIEFHLDNVLEYSRTEYLPIGTTAEVISSNALKRCYNNIDPRQSEYLMLYMFNPVNYKCGVIIPYDKDFSKYTLTVDTKEDLIRTKKIANILGDGFYRANVSKIINIIETCNIKNALFNNESPVKFPDNKLITYSEFRYLMDKRINDSQVKLSINLEEI